MEYTELIEKWKNEKDIKSLKHAQGLLMFALRIGGGSKYLEWLERVDRILYDFEPEYFLHLCKEDLALLLKK